MIRQVPEGQTRVFGPASPSGGEERYFQVWQSWDYQPDRIAWSNYPSFEVAPWLGPRTSPRMSPASLPQPEVRFNGSSKDVGDFYAVGTQVHFISEALFQLIDGIHPGSLEHVEFALRAKDSELPFRAVMPRRTLGAIDPRHTMIVLTDDVVAGKFVRRVRFGDSIIFNNEALAGVATFTDLDAPGWYWSMDLIERAKAQGIRGLYAQSLASSPTREVARL